MFGEMREMVQYVNASLFLVLLFFFGKNRDIFMAIICDMAKGRLADHKYFLEIIHVWIKTNFMRKKVASSDDELMLNVLRCQLTY